MPLVADFETTTIADDCRVWAWGLVDVYNDSSFQWGNSIKSFLDSIAKYDKQSIYFHNLKFDGEFIISYLLNNGFECVEDRKDLDVNKFTTLISDTGQFYTMTIKYKYKRKNITIKFLDSLKILPFSVEQISQAFNLPMKKGEIDYKKFREENYIPDSNELSYIKNDVIIVANALRTLFDENLTKMTQGSNALFDCKNVLTKPKFDTLFPQLLKEVDLDIRATYKGGFTYANPLYQNIDMKDGLVFDVNSLYPFVMREKELPWGEPLIFYGEYEYDELYPLYTIAFRCTFNIKKDHIPTIQIKKGTIFLDTEYATTTNGEEVILHLTNIDYELFLNHYDVDIFEFYGGWKFRSMSQMLAPYIDKWYERKQQATIDKNFAMRTLAKLMLNALYGKFGTNPKVQNKYPYLDKDGVVKYKLSEIREKDSVYIPMATFITSWARRYTIEAAQLNYDRFLYADTDSLHLSGLDIPNNIEIDSLKLGAWKHESTFTKARYLRAKSYIEEIDGKLCITCAGMPKSCHKFITWDNFREGWTFGGKLQHKSVKGGVVLQEIDFTIKQSIDKNG